MLGLNRILLATDFSASATAALLYAAALTRLAHATLLTFPSAALSLYPRGFLTHAL